MKTGKFLMAFAAIATVSMSSCSQEEEFVVPDSQLSDNVVMFGTYIGASRGTVMNNTTLQGSGFGVMAYYTGQDNFGATSLPNFMYNQQVTYSTTSNAWTYTPLKYWPNNSGDKISFFAYAPYASTFGSEGITSISANNVEGDPTLDFVVAANVEDQIDLLYAGAVGEVENSLLNLTKPAASEKITLNFKHALSRVSFSRVVLIDELNDRALDDNTTITINSVTLSAMNFGTKGTLNLNSGEWTVPADGYSTKNYLLEAKDDSKSDSKDNFVNYVITSENSKDVMNLTADDSNIMFIPVVSETEGNEGSSTITVVYTVSTADNNLSGNKSEIKNTATVNVPSFKFEAGKAYNFVLKIGMTSVKLDPQVADWTEGTITGWESIVF